MEGGPDRLVGKQKRIERLLELQTWGEGCSTRGGFFLFLWGGASFPLLMGGGEGRSVFTAANASKLRVGEGWHLSRLPVLCQVFFFKGRGVFD